MKLLDSRAELKSLITLCKASERVSGMLLASVTQESYHYAPTREAFKRLYKITQAEGSIPDWSALCSDPNISEKSRKVLRAYDGKPVHSRDKVMSLAKALDRYRQLRGVTTMAERIYNEVEGEKIDVAEFIDSLSDDLLKVRSRSDTKSQLKHTGKGNNSSRLIKDLLYGKKKRTIPTGFKAFDEKNGGFLEGSLVIIAANSGGGKSALANQLAINVTQQALEDVCLIPLEMTEQQMWARTLGVLTGIDVNKIQQQLLTNSEKKVLKKAYAKFAKDLKKKDTRHTVWSPEEDMSIEEMLFMLKPYGYKMIIVDYIGLLKGADGDDQVKELGRIARFAKVFAKNTGTTVVLLAQLSDEGQVKYARAIKEHANNLWSWHCNDDEAEVSIYDIKQQKARNQLRFNFQLQSHNASMRITDVDDSTPLGDADSGDDKGKKRGKDKHRKGKSDKRAKGNAKKDNDGYLEDLNDSSGSDDSDE